MAAQPLEWEGGSEKDGAGADSQRWVGPIMAGSEEGVVSLGEWRPAGATAGDKASGGVRQLGWMSDWMDQSGARIEGGAFEVQARNCAATATAVKW